MKKTLGILAVIITLSSACTRTPVYEPVTQTVSRSFNFEDGTFAGLYTNEVPGPSAAIIQSAVAIGIYAAKITVKPEDVVANGNRSELAIYDCAPYGATVFYRFCFYIPAGDPDDFKWQIISQLYQLPDFERGETFDWFYQHPPVYVTYVPGYIELKLTVGGEITAARTPVTKGVWHTNVLEVKLFDDGRGYVEARLDGTPYTPQNGGTCRYAHATLHNRAGAYWKLGLYRGHPGTDAMQAKSTNTMYLDDIRIGTSFAEVYP